MQRWLEIVGVVRDMGMAAEPAPKTAGAYLPLRLGELDAGSVMIAARVSGDMTAATNALRSIAATANPALRVSDVQPLSLVTANGLRTVNYVVRALSVVSLAALVLALSGIYAVMSFTVSRRTREIGIRVALGSTPSRVVFSILRRPLIQVAAGVVAGGVCTYVLASLANIRLGFAPGLIAYAVVMLGVCLLACVIPARRALNVDPIAALRAD
jgi:ABC-type antimicrobial peptide transport system permease subunit